MSNKREMIKIMVHIYDGKLAAIKMIIYNDLKNDCNNIAKVKW